MANLQNSSSRFLDMQSSVASSVIARSIVRVGLTLVLGCFFNVVVFRGKERSSDIYIIQQTRRGRGERKRGV